MDPIRFRLKSFLVASFGVLVVSTIGFVVVEKLSFFENKGPFDFN